MATAEAAAFARVEALHPVVADPEVREELRHAYARYQAREGVNAAPWANLITDKIWAQTRCKGLLIDKI